MTKRKRKTSMTEKNAIVEQQQVACLPICIVSEIISRLPTKMILRCRCVCKSWNALTRESSFIKNHFQSTKQHHNQYMLQVCYGSNTQNLSLLDIHNKKAFKIPFNRMKLPALPTYPNQYRLSTYSILCAYDGLLCMRPKGKIDNVIICNPITKDCFILPSTTTKELLKPCMSYQLGVCFDNTSRKYKVIREFRFSNYQPSKFQMITVGEGAWKDLDPLSVYIVEKGFEGAVFWNEAFHWKLSETILTHVNECVLSFDIVEEKFFTIPFPCDDDENYYYPQKFQLVGLSGNLKIVEHERCRFMKIWKVIGDKIEGFSVVLEYTYIFCVPPSRMLQYEVICEISQEIYLLQVNALKLGVNKSILQIFSPKTTSLKLKEFDINGLPLLFKYVCFKPTLFSPLLA